MPFPRPLVAAVAPLLLLAVTACTGPAPAPAPPASAPVAAPTGTDVPKAEPSSAAAAGVDPIRPPKPLVPGASVDVTTWNEHQTASVRVEIVRLERRDKLAIAVLAVTPTSSGTKEESMNSWLAATSPAPALIDTVGLKKYGVVSAPGFLRTDPVEVRMAAGQTGYYYAVFAAPPSGVTSVDVLFSSAIPPFKNVPMS